MFKNKIIAVLLMLCLLSSYIPQITLDVYANGEPQVHIPLKNPADKTFKAYSSIEAYNRKDTPIFIQLNRNHPDNKEMFVWADKNGLSALYNSWLPLTHINSVDEGIRTETPVYIWDYPMGNADLNNYTPTNNFEDLNLLALHENNQKTLGNDGLYLVSDNNNNLKYPDANNTGTFFVNFKADGKTPELDTSGVIPPNQKSSKKYEWRYVGFSVEGDIIPGEAFPVDKVSPNINKPDRNWIPWDTMNKVYPTDETEI